VLVLACLGTRSFLFGLQSTASLRGTAIALKSDVTPFRVDRQTAHQSSARQPVGQPRLPTASGWPVPAVARPSPAKGQNGVSSGAAESCSIKTQVSSPLRRQICPSSRAAPSA